MLVPRYIQEPSLITPTTQNTGLNAALTSVSKDTLFSHVLAHRSALGLDRFLYQSLVFCDPVQRRCPYYSRWVWCANQSYHPPKPCPIDCARWVRIKNVSGRPKSRSGCREEPVSRPLLKVFFCFPDLGFAWYTVSRSRISVSCPHCIHQCATAVVHEGKWIFSGLGRRGEHINKGGGCQNLFFFCKNDSYDCLIDFEKKLELEKCFFWENFEILVENEHFPM